MHIYAQPFWEQKLGNSLEEYEDAYWPRRLIDKKAPHFRFAVADGATETSFSGLWAHLLVCAYYHGAFQPNRINRAISRIQQAWLKQVSKKSLPWFAEEKVRQGAFSSILGFSISDADQPKTIGEWHSIAVGDSCLCQIRNNSLLASFPLASAAEFNSRPTLISSNPKFGLEQSHINELKGEWKPGDSFFLMTDALACWFLGAIAKDERPWEIILDFDTEGQPGPFSEWVHQTRQRGEIKNDDVTLLRITVE